MGFEVCRLLLIGLEVSVARRSEVLKGILGQGEVCVAVEEVESALAAINEIQDA
jgi:hypothetical protein